MLAEPNSLATTRGVYVLLDDQPEDGLDGPGLKISYDGSGPAPCITLDSPDGMIELRGAREIRAAAVALRCGRQLADTFGPTMDLDHWRQLNA